MAVSTLAALDRLTQIDSDNEDTSDKRRSREKFRRERADYDRREDRREERKSEQRRSSGGGRESSWSSRHEGARSRDSYRGGDYESRGSRRERNYSPQRRDNSPPHKRPRRDWEYDAAAYGPGGPGNPNTWAERDAATREARDITYSTQHGSYNTAGKTDPPMQTQPPMMTFKAFLVSQDDSISDEEAVKKYNEYKMDFKKQMINAFFLAHKEEEWFKSKYHPEECEKRKEEFKAALKKRVEVFNTLYDNNWLDTLSLDGDRREQITKYLDAVVILLEGGTEFDLAVLDQPEVDETEEKKPEVSASKSTSSTKIEESSVKKSADATDSEGEIHSPKSEGEIHSPKSDGEIHSPKKDNNDSTDGAKPKKEKSAKKEKKKKRRRDRSEYSYKSDSNSDESGSSSSGSDSSDSDEEEDEKDESKIAPPGEGDDVPMPAEENTKKESEQGEVDDGGMPSFELTEEDFEKETKPATNGETNPEKEKSDTEEKEADTTEENNEPKPKAFHKTSSIFLKNLAPSSTKQEVEALCKRYPGYMRVALQDPQPERGFMRRGWVTFDRTVNIKEICWNLNNMRLRDIEMGATVNKELKTRVRTVNGLSAEKSVVRNDIKHAAKIIQNMDSRWGLWDDEEKKDAGKESFGLVSKNPVLKNITDYLVEEGSYEEEALLGQAYDDGTKEENPEVTIERDDKLNKVLDRMVLYLRVVHSFDYYNHSKYDNEDEMPHRCGIIHARGEVMISERFTQNDINEYINNFSKKITFYENFKNELDNDEATRLGLKEVESEVNKFITANTQELAKDKWLCPLSGKKFKGPDFVRKHIFNKHGEKIEEVKAEVAYFNNYLRDPKRPKLPEHPGPKSTQRQSREDFHGGSGYGGPPMHGFGQRGGAPYSSPPYSRERYSIDRRPNRGNNYGMRNNRRGNFGGGGGRSRPDPRSIIEYRDLDAPEDLDMF